jgi:hypothetical protein
MATLHQLLTDRPVIDRVTISSHQMSIYLVELILDGQPVLLRDEQGRPRMFRSLQQVKDSLAPLSIRRVLLRQDSAFHEMAGLPAQSVAAMELPLHWSREAPTGL